MRARSLLAHLSLLLVPLSAWAWPVDLYVDLEAGAERFHRLFAVSWVEVEDPKVATAEVLESGELLLSGVSPGRTLLLLYADGQLAVWRLRVAAKGERPRPVAGAEALAEAEKACPGLSLGRSEGPTLTATLEDERCRRALLKLFETDEYASRQLELTFELPVLQAQLQSIQAGVPPKAKVSYRGAGLIAEGELSAAEHRKLLWELFRRSAGRVALDDRVRVETTEP